jgi:hypothetical protein
LQELPTALGIEHLQGKNAAHQQGQQGAQHDHYQVETPG